MQSADIVIAGGAVMGSSLAWHLASHAGFSGRIVVVEPDFTYAKAASALSASSIRQQFSQPVNIAISLHGIAFLREIGERLAVGDERPEIGLKEGGYLYLGFEQARALYAENNAAQRKAGADIALMEPSGLESAFPWLNTDDLAIGSFGRSGEGWFDGYGLMMAFRKAARAKGAEYVEARVTGLTRAGDCITHVSLSNGETVACGAFVNCAGASGARDLAQMAGYPVPVFAKKRCVFGFQAEDKLDGFPLLIDTSGLWVRPEGEGYICGYSPDDLDESDHAKDFAVDWPIFEEVIWPALAHRVPAFERIRQGRAWAGHYDMNLFDHNAIVGRHDGLANGFIACGFSGHGIQQSPAVGRGLAELIISGRFETLDLSDLGYDRIGAGKPLLERNVI
jgi:FAD-dependent oxidoreductase domain-containing protein 1